MKKINILEKRLKGIINVIPSIDDVETKLSEAILPLLTAKLNDGYNLSAFKYGVSDFGYEFIPYVHRSDASTQWCPSENSNYKSCIREIRTVSKEYATGIYNDEFLIKGIWGFERIIDSVPPILQYFELPFTEEGILDAWILWNLRDLLPKYWHANYNAKIFIYGKQALNKLFPKCFISDSVFASERNTVKEAIRALDINELLPQIVINGDTAMFTCAYWNHFRGLYKMETTFERTNNGMRCSSQREICLVPHRSDIMF